MSYADGWSAINLEMPPRVPHTVFSLESHWEVIHALTGIEVGPQSTPEEQASASLALIKACNGDFRCNTLLHTQPFGDYRTRIRSTTPEVEDAPGGNDPKSYIICPFHSPEEVLSFNFARAYGNPDRQEWKNTFEEHYRQACAEAPDMVNTTGIDCTTLSGMLEIFGWEMLLLAAGSDLEEFGALTTHYAEWILPYFEALAETDIPVVLIHDEIVWASGPIFSQTYYRSFLFPCYKKLFAPLLDAKKKIIFASEGNYTRFIDDIAACGVHGFMLEPGTDMAYLAEKYGESHVFIGNTDTRVLLSGSMEDIRAEVERCMAIGKKYPGYFLATSNQITGNIPVENVLFYLKVYEELSKR